MPKFFVRFNVVEEWQGTFDADNIEEAEKLIQQINDDEISTTDLRNFDDRNRGIFVEMDKGSLEELS